MDSKVILLQLLQLVKSPDFGILWYNNLFPYFEKHHGGVAIIMNRNVTKAKLEYSPVNERIIRARFQTKQGKLTIIQCYAPTNEADGEEKTDFYLVLQSEIEKVPKHDVKIVMGDLIAKDGNDNTGNERVMGKYGCGNINDNGERLIDLCGTNNLVIGGTIFPHREMHKLTWISPNGRDKNQIDHIVINGKWRRSLQDVRVMRVVDVASDHHIVVADIKLKLIKQSTHVNVKRKFDVGKLQDPNIKQEFKLEIKNRFQLLENQRTENTDTMCTGK